MVDVIEIEGQDDEDQLKCQCGHEFHRDRLDIRQKVYIPEWEGDRDDFNIDEYVTERQECPICSCCSIEDDSIEPTTTDDEWMCGRCLTKYEDEDEAVDCCSDKG